MNMLDPTLEDYAACLRKKGRVNKTINTYQLCVRLFLIWCKKKKIETAFITYDELLQYTEKLRKSGIQHQTVQSHHLAIRHYFDMLIGQGLLDTNPILAIKLKGQPHKAITHILSKDQLEALYNAFGELPQKDPFTFAREKTTLGLMIFQGLASGEIGKLTTEKVNLEKGTITVLGTQHRAMRTLALEARQIIALHHYIEQVRPQLLVRYPQNHLNKLIVHGSDDEASATSCLLSKVKAACPYVRNGKQVRASVITHWLKAYNLREVQYMAGHHTIKSTEAYLRNDTEGLQNAIDQYHPALER